MTRLPRWTIGFLRLSVVAFVIGWITTTGFIFNHDWRQDHLSTLEGTVNPDFKKITGIGPLPNDWSVIAASESFLSKSDADKKEQAKKYFEIDSLSKYWAEQACLDVKEVERWFVQTATLSLEEVPIQEHSSVGYGIIRYRSFSVGSMPKIKLWRAFLNAETFYVTFMCALGFLLIVLIGFFTGRWVVRGFRGSFRSTPN